MQRFQECHKGAGTLTSRRIFAQIFQQGHVAQPNATHYVVDGPLQPKAKEKAGNSYVCWSRMVKLKKKNALLYLNTHTYRTHKKYYIIKAAYSLSNIECSIIHRKVPFSLSTIAVFAVLAM